MYVLRKPKYYLVLSFEDGATVFVPERQGHVRGDLP